MHPLNKLTALAVNKQTTPGRYSDGNELYLVVDSSGSKRWLQCISVQGKRCDLGLGSVRLASLGDAHEQAPINHRIARAGDDQLPNVSMKRASACPSKTQRLKFIRLTCQFGETKNTPHNGLRQWKIMFFPKIGAKPVGSIQSTDILAVLEPIWTSKPDTAKKIHQRMNMFINWARGRGLFKGEDPIKMAELSLPKIKQSKNHFKSLNCDEMPS